MAEINRRLSAREILGIANRHCQQVR